MYLFLKIFTSAVIIGVITEIARKFPTYGGIIAALPLVSLLSISWLYLQGASSSALRTFAFGVISGIPATLCMLICLYLGLKWSWPLWGSIGFGIAAWFCFLLLQERLLPLVLSS